MTELGRIWIDDSTEKVYILTSKTGSPLSATWIEIADGTPDGTDGQVRIGATGAAAAWANITSTGGTLVVTNGANTINMEATGGTANSYPTDAGTATPLLGVTQMSGGANLNSSGVGNVVTFNLDASPAITGDLTVAGSITAGVDLNMTTGDCTIEADSDATDTILLEADGGTNETIRIQSVQGTGVDSVNLISDVGGITLDAGLAAANSIIIDASDAAGGIDCDYGTGGMTVTGTNGDYTLATGTGAINLGADAAAKTITIGNATGATAVTVDCGTGGANFGASGTAHATTIGSTNTTSSLLLQSGTGDVAVTSNDAITLDAVGVLELNSSAGIIGIGNDAVAQNINVGTGAAARTITIGNVTGATDLALNSGTGGIALASTGAGDITIDSDDTLLLDSDGVLELNSSAGIIGIGSDADAFGINIGTGAAQRDIVIGNITGTTGIDLTAGSGDIVVTATDSIISLSSGTGAVNIATDAAAHVLTLGSVNTTAQTVVQSGTDGTLITSTDEVLIDSAGVLELNSSAGVISIGNDAVAQNIGIGTGAAARVITIGNVTGATQVVLDCGTAGVNVGASATDHPVTVGSIVGASLTRVQAGTGDLICTSTDAITLDATGVLELNSTAGAIGIGSDADAQNINVGTGAAARVITIGNVTGATQLVLNSGTAGIQLASTGAGDITIDSDDTLLLDSDGVLELNSSAGVISIGNDAVAQNINIGTGAAARVTTIGNVTGASQVVLDCGTAGIDVGTSATAHTTTVGSTNTTSDTVIQSGSGGITLAGGGIGDVAVTPVTNTVAGVALTVNGRVSVSTFTGQVTASGAQETFTITNNAISATSAILVTVNNVGGNDARMTLEQVKPAAGSVEIMTQNNGAAALNGNVIITMWVIA